MAESVHKGTINAECPPPCGAKFSVTVPDLELVSGLKNAVAVGQVEMTRCPVCLTPYVPALVNCVAIWGLRTLTEAEAKAMGERLIMVPKLAAKVG